MCCSVTEEGEKRKNVIDIMLLLEESEPEFYTDAVMKGIILVRPEYSNWLIYFAPVKMQMKGNVGRRDGRINNYPGCSSLISDLKSNEFNKARDEIDSNVGQS
ncbi:hypothetical protein RHSIM_Rhsim07G0223100 [Rhododendron simsii]|uniref:Uncharacterized protein n=1 Tax=Rhododendron simsii TaxID=118357 RepID=A0A834GT71_RHOSS|nr:hypothetical protein RHSIM_Rhsim07G0223100 [Rhododendron simsii]